MALVMGIVPVRAIAPATPYHPDTAIIRVMATALVDIPVPGWGLASSITMRGRVVRRLRDQDRVVRRRDQDRVVRRLRDRDR